MCVFSLMYILFHSQKKFFAAYGLFAYNLLLFLPETPYHKLSGHFEKKIKIPNKIPVTNTAWKVSVFGVFLVRTGENTDQNNFCSCFSWDFKNFYEHFLSETFSGEQDCIFLPHISVSVLDSLTCKPTWRLCNKHDNIGFTCNYGNIRAATRIPDSNWSVNRPTRIENGNIRAVAQILLNSWRIWY